MAKFGGIHEDAMEEFYKLPLTLLARLIRAIPPEAAAATEPKNTREKRPHNSKEWLDASWKPAEENTSESTDQDGDLHDCVYELFFFYLYGWVPRNYELDRQHYLTRLEKYGSDETKELSFGPFPDRPLSDTINPNKLIAVAWREHFKRELCSVLSFVLDPKPDIKKGAYGRNAQSETPIKDVRPRLILSTDPKFKNKPSRYLCTPVSLGGLIFDAIEVLDMIIYNLGRYTDWYYDNPDTPKGGRHLEPAERRTGRAEALITVVPQRGTIKTLSGTDHQYYSGPLHTVLRKNQRDVSHLKRFMNQTKLWWKPHVWRIKITTTSNDNADLLFYPSVPGWETSASSDELLDIIMGKRRGAKLRRDFMSKNAAGKAPDIRATNDMLRSGITMTRLNILHIREIITQNNTCIKTPTNAVLDAYLADRKKEGKKKPVPVIFKKGVFYETTAFDTTDAALEAVFPGYTHGSSY